MILITNPLSMLLTVWHAISRVAIAPQHQKSFLWWILKPFLWSFSPIHPFLGHCLLLWSFILVQSINLCQLVNLVILLWSGISSSPYLYRSLLQLHVNIQKFDMLHDPRQTKTRIKKNAYDNHNYVKPNVNGRKVVKYGTAGWRRLLTTDSYYSITDFKPSVSFL